MSYPADPTEIRGTEPQTAPTPGILAWEDPPARGTARYAAAAGALKANPGRWGVVQVAVGEGKVNAAGWRKGLTFLLGEGKFEVREHAIPNSETRVYARYTG